VFAISDAQSAISNRLAGPLPVVQNSVVVEKYLRLFGNKIETLPVRSQFFWGAVAAATWSPHSAATNFRSGSGPKSIVNGLEKRVIAQCDHQRSERVRSPETRHTARRAASYYFSLNTSHY
jgi:hypothetical protein